MAMSKDQAFVLSNEIIEQIKTRLNSVEFKGLTLNYRLTSDGDRSTKNYLQPNCESKKLSTTI
jgi:hypothetical protein